MRVLVVLFALMLVVLPAAAQEDTRPRLLRVLSAAPDTTAIRNANVIATFVDYQATLALRGIQSPPISDLSGEGELPTPLSMALAFGPEVITRTFPYAAEMSGVLGFDFFDIGQAAEIGTAPANALILTGSFNAQAVIDAHLARGYTQEDGESGIVLCGTGGCEGGASINLANRNGANPFGGSMGKSEPLIVNSRRILNAQFLPLLNRMSEAAQGRIPSLADAKDVQAVAYILSYRTYVSAVILVSPAAVSIVDATASSGRFSNFMGRLKKLPPLPPYSLIAISNSADAEYEYGDLLLIYPTLDSASRAYESIMSRLDVVESVTVQGRTVEQRLNEVGEFMPPQVVTDEKTNFSALQLTVRSPLSNAEPADFSRAFRYFYQMLTERDTVLIIPTE